MKILLCPLSDGGYLYPAIAAGRELSRRGHDVCAVGRASVAPVLAEAGLPFVAAEDLGVRSGFAAARWGVTGLAQYLAVRRAAVLARADLLVTSVLCHGALVAAEVLDVPAVVVGLSVYLWDYLAGGDDEPQFGRTRENRTQEMSRFYADLREQAGLAAMVSRWPQNPLLGEALLLRGDPAMEYPGAVLPDRVQHVGPMAWEPAADPGELDALRGRLDLAGKPVVYVHLGRFFGGSSHWPALNAAFASGGTFQAVVEQGRSTRPEPAPGSDILLVRKPWMGPLIDMARLVLTSGTSAPVLAALLRGRPLGVCPNGAEQPLLAGACVRLGVARYVLDERCEDHQALLRSAWQDHEVLERVMVLGRRLASADGASRAADVIEWQAGGAPPGSHRPSAASSTY